MGKTGEGSRFEVRGFLNFEPRTSNRALLALHAPRSVALADFFSLLLGNRPSRDETGGLIMATHTIEAMFPTP